MSDEGRYESLQKQLSGHQPPVTTLVVGAGAVEGAWEPVLKALRPYIDIPLTPDGANAFLARLVYLLRWFSADPSEYGRKQLQQYKKILVRVRSDIAKALQKAEDRGQLRVRPEFEDVIFKRVRPLHSKLILVTTNWDGVVGSALTKLLSNQDCRFICRPQHIHGCAKTPNLMYLPTEMTKEPYRSSGEERRIGGLHSAIWQAMELSQRSIVYGLSLSPLDAELAQTLACGWSTPLIEEIEIIAPDHDVISHRVNLLTDPRKHVKVHGYHPSDLANYVDHSVKRTLV